MSMLLLMMRMPPLAMTPSPGLRVVPFLTLMLAMLPPAMPADKVGTPPVLR